MQHKKKEEERMIQAASIRNRKSLRNLPCVFVMGTRCWTPQTFAMVMGVSRNTVLNWARKTKRGEMNLPIISSDKAKSRVYIKVDEAIDWANYGTV